jgi:hypothetical protein
MKSGLRTLNEHEVQCVSGGHGGKTDWTILGIVLIVAEAGHCYMGWIDTLRYHGIIESRDNDHGHSHSHG